MPAFKGGIAKVVIERTIKRITLTILYTARPGVVIGKVFTEVDRSGRIGETYRQWDVQINIFEIKRPELDAPAWWVEINRSQQHFGSNILPSCHEAVNCFIHASRR